MSADSTYWEQEWQSQPIEEYHPYLQGHMHAKTWFLSVFQENDVVRVCDAACGFGAYSAMLAANGYLVSGFDSSKTAVSITKQLLNQNNLTFEDVVLSDICKINFPDQTFDAVVAHAVIDHLDTASATIALGELHRITKPGGFIYVSFDPLEPDDLTEPHDVLPDGSFLYTTGSRDGLLFRYYTANLIRELSSDYHIFKWRINRRGEREVLYQKY